MANPRRRSEGDKPLGKKALEYASRKESEKRASEHNKRLIQEQIAMHNYRLKQKKKLEKKVTWADIEHIGKVTLPRYKAPNVVWSMR